MLPTLASIAASFTRGVAPPARRLLMSKRPASVALQSEPVLSPIEDIKAAVAAGAVVVDIRPPDGSQVVNGVFSMINGSLSQVWDREAQTMPTAALPEDKSAPLVLTCRSGKKVSEAIPFLREQGFTGPLLNGGGPMTPEFWAAFGDRTHDHDLGAFAQLFDGPAPDGGGSSTYTYILGDKESGECIIIDPVLEQVERDLAAVQEMGLQLTLALNTHCHADHVTGTGELKRRVPGLRSMISAASGAKADEFISPNQKIGWAGGARTLEALPTPGHTNGCLSLHDGRMGAVFTGDTLLIGGCGRTDFQEGSADTLYDSVHSELFSLPPSTIVFPAHGS